MNVDQWTSKAMELSKTRPTKEAIAVILTEALKEERKDERRRLRQQVESSNLENKSTVIQTFFPAPPAAPVKSKAKWVDLSL